MADQDNKRRSRRQKGEEPEELDDNNQILTQELKCLTSRGGVGGRNYGDATDWVYFPQTTGDLSEEQRDLHNKDIFNNIDAVRDSTLEYDNETAHTSKATYQLVHMTRFRNFINSALTCRCALDCDLDSFCTYLHSEYENKSFPTCDEMNKLKDKWKKERELETTINLKVKTIGIEPIITVCCAKCGMTSTFTNDTDKY